jgi:hypothetical protein
MNVYCKFVCLFRSVFLFSIPYVDVIMLGLWVCDVLLCFLPVACPGMHIFVSTRVQN